MAPALASSVRFRALPSSAVPANSESTATVAHVHFRSHHKAPLVAGDYEVNFVQRIEAPNGFSGPKAPFQSAQKFTVQGPAFQLDPVTEIDSVFPAPGHSDHANTLPHIVFTDPILPWERRLADASRMDAFNATPWLAVLTFTEDELKLGEAEIRALALQPGPRPQTPTLALDMTAKELIASGTKGYISALNPRGTAGQLPNGSREIDPVSAIFLEPDLFKALFSDYAESTATPVWTGKPCAKRYAHFAHVQRIHAHHMASTAPGEAQQRDCAIVLSHRVGVIAPTQPTNIVVHVVSLSNIEEITLGGNTKRIGLVSLHSWTWMAIPADHVNFVHTMTALSKAEFIQPLRMTDRFLAEFLKLKATHPHSKTDATQRLVNRLLDGYIIKKHTLNTGKTRSCLFRGPLSPQIPPIFKGRPSSQNGADLEAKDELTNLPNVSYSAAWQLGRLLAVGDPAFLKCLLWLRGKIHSDAARLTKEGIDPNFLGIEEYLKQLPEAVEAITSADDNPTVAGGANAFYRWHTGRGTPGYVDKVAWAELSLARICRSSQYQGFVEKVTTELASATAPEGKSNTPMIYNETNSPTSHDWAKVLEWILDVLFTGKIPLHYLVPDPESIPPESIRTFFVDPAWLERVVDGALSLANHLEPDDDAIGRELKRMVNTYLATPLGDGPDAQLPRLPRWGFFLRSIAVSAFPDLRVEVPTKGNPSRSDILLMQRMGEDVLMFLLDRIPGERDFSDVVLSRPGHENGFTLGDGASELTAKELTISFRRLPSSPATYDYGKEEGVHVKTWSFDGTKGGKPVFDWKSRTLNVPEFVQQCIGLVGGPVDDRKFFSWNPAQHGGVPSSIIATQLSKSVFRLKIGSGPDPALQALLADPARNPWRTEKGARRIYMGNETKMKISVLEGVTSEPMTLPLAPLPTFHRVEIPAPLRPSYGGAIAHQMDFSSVPDYPAVVEYAYSTGKGPRSFKPHVAIFQLHIPYDQDNWTLPRHGLPVDLVVRCDGDTADSLFGGMPAEWHFLIPIRLSSYPADKDAALRSIPALLQIAGDRDHLELPTIEPIYAGPRWMYDMSVCYGGRWEEDMGTYGYKAQKTKHWVSYLWIRARSAARWGNMSHEKKLGSQRYNVSFLLKGARLDPPASGSTKEVEVNFVGFNAWQFGLVRHTCVIKKIKVSSR